MKKLCFLLAIGLLSIANIFAQNQAPKPLKVETRVKVKKHISSSILLWVRRDKPRQESMDRWKGPHSKIISANKGLDEYRQIHLAEANTGLWAATPNVETTIPANRRIDGIAEVTLKNLLSALKGKKQNRLAFKDEVNLFHRTIFYLCDINKSLWYEVATPNEKVEARTIVYLRKKEGVSQSDFRDFINKEVGPTLANMNVLKELRSQTFKPWKQKQWDSPNVAHDNAPEVQFHGSLILGFSNENEMQTFLNSEKLKQLSVRMSEYCTAIHAYQVSEALTFVKNGKIIP